MGLFMNVRLRSLAASVATGALCLPPANASLPRQSDEWRQTVATYAVSCTYNPRQSQSNGNDYLWRHEAPARLVENYNKTRAFYGCADWPSAVAATWTMTSLLKQHPDIGVAAEIRDVFRTHLGKTNLDGEYAFFSALQGQWANHQKPYGYAWYLKLFGELQSWPADESKQIVEAMRPLAQWMTERYVTYLYELKFPYRAGDESNTAFAMLLALDYANSSGDEALRAAIQSNAVRLFGNRKDCPARLEPASGDTVSSCLSEAALMSRAMATTDFARWLNEFLPTDSEDVQVYARPFERSRADGTGVDARLQMRVKARQIGLNFARAASLLTIAAALPEDDRRAETFRKMAQANAQQGYAQFDAAGSEGHGWLPPFVLLYENALAAPVPKTPRGQPGET
jgi:hypothetical protein